MGQEQSQAQNLQKQLLTIYYEEQECLTRRLEEFEDVETTARRLFNIPQSQKLILSTELPRINMKKIDIDPEVWPTIKDSVTGVWVRKSLTDIKPSKKIQPPAYGDQKHSII